MDGVHRKIETRQLAACYNITGIAFGSINVIDARPVRSLSAITQIMYPKVTSMELLHLVSDALFHTKALVTQTLTQRIDPGSFSMFALLFVFFLFCIGFDELDLTEFNWNQSSTTEG